MEERMESVVAAERHARRQKAKSNRLRAHSLHLNSERLDILLRGVHGKAADRGYGQASGHAYLFLDPVTHTVARVLYLYEQKGRYVVPIGKVTYLCDTLAEAEGRLYDWAEESGIISRSRPPAFSFGNPGPLIA